MVPRLLAGVVEPVVTPGGPEIAVVEAPLSVHRCSQSERKMFCKIIRN